MFHMKALWISMSSSPTASSASQTVCWRLRSFQRSNESHQRRAHRPTAAWLRSDWTADGGEEPRQRDGGTRVRHFAPAEEAVRENL